MSKSAVQAYIEKVGTGSLDTGCLNYITSLEQTAAVAPEVASAIVQELSDQRTNLKLIASENYTSLSTQASMGNLLTDKYAEGFPYHRFYAGCDNVDAIEYFASEQACKLFGADHAYVQPHSGADANLVAYWAVLSARIEGPMLEELGETNPAKLSRQQWDEVRNKLGNQRLLGMDYYSGGHLTHGYRHNVSAQMFDAYSYSVSRETGLLDYDEIEALAQEIRPLILLAGYSAYPRKIDFSRMRDIADAVGAVLMVDMAHFAGLVAGGQMSGIYNPVAYADIVTTTTHKTLRGPRGGMVLCTDEYADAVDKGCPMVLGGPLPHVMGAKAVCFTEALRPEFSEYATRIVQNSQALAQACIDEGITVATGGSDNHLMLLDVRGFGINGRQAESVLRECGFTLNRNALPFDPNGPWYTSGLRIGTPAVTTLGMGESEMKEIASIIAAVLGATSPRTLTKGKNAGKPSKAKYVIDSQVVKEAQGRISSLLARFPVYPNLDLDFLQNHFSL
ncbi:MAG: glycine hydroxymethyltransferase [Spirochaetota bacterium]